MVPPLLDALRDPDEGVVAEARLGLQLLARKVEGFGPPPSANLEQKEAAIAKWRAWYESTRPLAPAADDPATPGPAAGRRAP